MPAARATLKQPVSTVAGKNDRQRPTSLRESKRIISSRNVSEQQQQLQAATRQLTNVCWRGTRPLYIIFSCGFWLLRLFWSSFTLRENKNLSHLIRFLPLTEINVRNLKTESNDVDKTTHRAFFKNEFFSWTISVFLKIHDERDSEIFLSFNDLMLLTFIYLKKKTTFKELDNDFLNAWMYIALQIAISEYTV